MRCVFVFKVFCVGFGIALLTP
ncbi:hypothetical protein CRN61_10315 [Vibrio vulnificus]|nr:hypothetical protein CRN54_06255 [Vibrio vulnificus]POC79507.1 hypothetical protein CRN61_10315 [Vibrio vulnificus]